MRKTLYCAWGMAICGLAALLVGANVARGQEVTATITGTVTDSTGAAVVGATVTAKSVERGITYTATSNESGIYRISQLPVGNYDLKFEKQGFQTTLRPAFTLVLNQIARIDVEMKVGQINQTIEVTGAAPVLKTEATQVDTIVNAATNDALPLATRNYVELALLAPGAVHPDPSSFNNGDNTASGGRPYINGNREQSNNFLLDGMDNNQVSDNLLGYTPAPDAIEEFNLITNNASPEFGNFEGGIVSVSIKSGTNNYHGDAWEFFRNDVLNANSWSNKFSGTPRDKLRWADPSSRTNSSSSWITRDSVLTIPAQPVPLPPLQPLRKVATSVHFVRWDSTRRAFVHQIAERTSSCTIHAPLSRLRVRLLRRSRLFGSRSRSIKYQPR